MNQPDDRQPDNNHGLDEDAAWREIVAHYGDEPDAGHDASEAEPADTDEPAGHGGRDQGSEGRVRGDVFDRSFLDFQERSTPELNTPASWDDEGHFVPPSPPPVPRPTPPRMAAWAGLFGAPTLMLLVIVLGWQFPTWLMGLLTAWFAGGFCYLVGTMPRARRDDWSGDDGAVV